jgi:hypothetical protein
VDWPGKGKPPAASSQPKAPEKPKDPVEESPKKVERPYDGVRPVEYVPLRPGERFGVKSDHKENKRGDDPNVVSRPGPAYRARAPIESGTSGPDLTEKLLDSQMEVSLRELLSVAPEVREGVRKYITKKRISPETAESLLSSKANEVGDALPFLEEAVSESKQNGEEERPRAIFFTAFASEIGPRDHLVALRKGREQSGLSSFLRLMF